MLKIIKEILLKVISVTNCSGLLIKGNSPSDGNLPFLRGQFMQVFGTERLTNSTIMDLFYRDK